MAEGRDDFAYVATLDLSEVDVQLGAIEQRMVTFTQDVLSQLTIIEAGFNKAFSGANIKLQAPTIEGADASSSSPVSAISDEVESSYRATQNALKALISEQLQLISANDGSAISLIKNAEAASTNVSQFKKLVTQLTSVTSQEFELAKSISETQGKIQSLNDQLNAGKINATQYENALAPLEETLKELGSLSESRLSTQISKEQQEAVKAYERAQKQLIETEKRASSEFQKSLRQFPKVRTELQKLVAQYGPFSARIGQTGEAASVQQRRFQQLLGTNKQLAAEVDRLTKEYGEFNVALNTSTVGANNQKSALSQLGSRLGIATGLAFALTNELIQMGRRGVQAFQEIVSSSVTVSQQFQAARISFAAIFEGNKEVAASTFDFVREKSRELGIDLAQIATTFLPQVDNLEQLTKLAELSTELLRLPAAIASNKTQQDAILAISELFAGQTRTLQTRFNITLEDTGRIKEALDERGVAGAIETLDEVLNDLGINFEDFTQETPFLLNKVRQSAIDLQDTLGTPIDREINEFATFLTEFLAENQDEIDAFTEKLGDALATITGFVGDNLIEFLENLDFEEAINGIEKFQENLKSTLALLDALSTIFSTITKLSKDFEEFQATTLSLAGGGEQFGFESSISLGPVDPTKFLLDFIADIQKININLKQMGAILTGVLELFIKTFTAPKEVIDAIKNDLEALNNIGAEIISNYGDTIGRVLDGTTSLGDAFKEFINTDLVPANAIFEAFGLTVDQSMDASADSVDEVTESVDGLADSILAAKRIAESEIEIAGIQAEIDPVQQEIRDEELKAKEEIEKRKLEIQRDFELKAIDQEIANSRKREKIERDLVDKLEDIDKKFFEKRDDIFLEFARDQEDASRDASRAQNDIERDAAKERIKIEEDLQRELARIRRRFAFDAQEAIRQNDAIAFLQLRRRLAFELNEAKLKRDEDVSDAEDKAEEEKEKVNQKLQEQIEDARLKRERGIEDAQRAAEREREAATTERDRSLREQTIAEQQFTDDLEVERQRRLDEYEVWADEKRQQVKDSLKDEYEVVKDGQERIADIELEIQELRLQQLSDYYQSATAMAASFDRNLIRQNPDIGEASSFDRNLVNNQGGIGGQGTGTGGTGPLANLQKLARNYARYYDLDTNTLLDYISTATVEQLQDLIRDLQDGVIDDDTIPRQFGGAIQSGQSFLVGENGPEIITPEPGFRGRVTPLMNREQYPIPGAMSQSVTNIDNSRTAQIDVSMLDMSSFSPDQVVIIKQMIGEIFLQSFNN